MYKKANSHQKCKLYAKFAAATLGSVDLCGLKFVQIRGYLIAARDL